MRLPAFFDHRPVGVVAVHGDVLATAAGSDAGVESGIADTGQKGLERLDIVKRTGFRHIAAVKQRMNAHDFDALCLGLHDHRLQVIDVAMHVAVGKEPDEMNGARFSVHPGFRTGNDLLPGLALPDGTGSNCIRDQRRALRIHLAGADGVVADLGVAHVVIGGHADGSAVRTQADVRALGKETVERRLSGRGNGAAGVVLRQAVAVHDNGDDRAIDTGEGGEFLQHGGVPAEMARHRKKLDGAKTAIISARCASPGQRTIARITADKFAPTGRRGGCGSAQ